MMFTSVPLREPAAGAVDEVPSKRIARQARLWEILIIAFMEILRLVDNVSNAL
jgi:hypothetical protein